MKICLLVVGKTSDKELDKLIARYSKRIGYYTPFDLEVIPDVKAAKGKCVERQKVDEGDEIIRRLNPTDLVILLDENGQQMTSRQFATMLQKTMVAGHKRLVFVVGGSFGFADSVYDAVSRRWSLSAMTFSHRMIRLFAVEQIYRAMTILRGEPYHHD